MGNYGFVHDKLEIKFLILYVMARIIEPVPFAKVLELTMCDDGFGYFDFSDCLAEMVTSKHLTLRDGLYSITDAGRSADEACMTSLAYSVRCKADVNIEAFNKDECIYVIDPKNLTVMNSCPRMMDAYIWFWYGTTKSLVNAQWSLWEEDSPEGKRRIKIAKKVDKFC